ncbi:hypothetical protein C1645_841128 [Glomus cerebriforme]|uniref:Uncharacterized protein n=1 Tax=Glomus cerebriforme TaxID=658196 RepID=A0A397SAB3_9GLOM|nr:hypothetical protein C1645_841128 [Glomus cerebriforme]
MQQKKYAFVNPIDAILPSQVFLTYPIQYMPSLPSQYCMVSREPLTSTSNFNNSSSHSKYKRIFRKEDIV